MKHASAAKAMKSLTAVETHRTTIDLSVEIYKKLRIMTAATGVYMKDFIEQAILEKLND